NRSRRRIGERGDVIDDARPRRERRGHGRSMTRVDGDAEPAVRERAYDWDHTALLFVRRNGCRARARGLAADVEDVGPLLRQLERVRDSSVGRWVRTAVGEAVGRHVDDAHEPWGCEIKTGERPR